MTDILVLGGTGKTGRRIVARLRAAGHSTRAAARSGPTRFDWDDPSTWDSALSGVRVAYLAAPELRLDIAEPVTAFLKQATDSGLRRVVLLSARGVQAIPDAPLNAIENTVRASGLEWTIVRPCWFAQNFDEGFFRGAIDSGELALPTGDGLEPFLDAEDIADVAVAALTEDGHAGQSYELSGPELLSFRSAVGMIAKASGRDIGYVDLTAEEFVARAEAQGTPTEFATIMASLLDGIRLGHDAWLSDGVSHALGRPARSFADYVRTARWT